MKPNLHAKISAKKFGGRPEDYIEIHNWFDQTKAHVADMRHRTILHNSFGIFLCEQVFGTMVQKPNGVWVKMPHIINSDGKEVNVRDVGEQHVLDDLGCIPSIDKSIKSMQLQEWMGGPVRKNKTILLNSKQIAKLKDMVVD